MWFCSNASDRLRSKQAVLSALIEIASQGCANPGSRHFLLTEFNLLFTISGSHGLSEAQPWVRAFLIVNREFEMKHLAAVIICLFTAFFIGSSAFGALDTAEIDKVSKKEVLQKEDLAAIDSFVAAGVQEILNSKDFSTIGKLRDEIVARAHSSQPSADIQYNPQFVAAAAKNLEKAFADARKISDPNASSKASLNLMILLDNLDNIKLADVALVMLNDENVTVRYWAVHAVTGPHIVEQFNTGKASAAVARTIAEKLAGRVGVETSGYILAQIAQFGAAVNVPQAQAFLMQIADVRLTKYQTGTVDSIPLDGTVLRLLADKLAGPDKAAAAGRFGQLLSYAMQLYIRDFDTMDAVQKEHLAAVLSQAESLLVKLQISTGIKRAIEKKDKQAIQTEYKDIFGDSATPGKFTTTLNVEYPSPDGTKRTTPLPLPELPKTK